MAPVVDGLKSEYDGKVEIRKIDLEKDPEGQKLAEEYGVQYVPTFVFLNADGSKSEVLVGAQSESKMRAALDKLE